jgi:hypothetical protein
MIRRKRKKESVPKLADIVKLSEEEATYRWICSKWMRCVVGNTQWNKRYYKEPLSDVATESDEAFLVLTIENNYDRWMAEVKDLMETNREQDDEEDGSWRASLPPAKYTNSGTSTATGKASSKRFQGWSREGYLRFNELHGQVKEDRKRRANFELDLKKAFAEEHANAQDADSSDSEEEEIFPANDMEGVQQATV